jgi:hypothetical protein
MREALVFEQAERVQGAEAKIASGVEGITDLFFVGAAGWADQDVFLNELQSARSLLDDRFHTRGRSVLLANDPRSRTELPLAAPTTLRHTLRAVGAKMNVNEDVLFLYITSHGSSEGLALGFTPGAAFRDTTLRPTDLRAMLDEAGIKWRILVISGCESGVFLSALKSDSALVATAAADDRPSYGCAMGNPFTDFGRALFAEQLPRERSFVTAFTNTTRSIAERESAKDLLASRPQLFVGSAIAPKLRELEAQLGNESRSAE